MRKLACTLLIALGAGCAPPPPVTAEARQPYVQRAAIVSEPSPAAILRVYPPSALSRRIGGSVRLVCTVVEGGALSDCAPRPAVPTPDFGTAALMLASSFRVGPVLPGAGGAALGKLVGVDVLFQPPPADIPLPTLVAVGYASLPEAADIHRFYPAHALRSDQQGRAVVQGTAGSQGRMAGCLVVEEEPAGMGFGMAAIRLVESTVAVPLQDGEGAPTSGRTARIPIRFLLPE
jgi:TonB family protein